MWRCRLFRPNTLSALGSALKRNLFIQVQDTPNPNSLKFLPGKKIIEGPKTLNYPTIKAARESPLAKRIFQIQGVTNVFLSQDFVTVTKDDDSDWNVLRPQVFATVMDHINSGLPAVDGNFKTEAKRIQDDPVVDMIFELLDTRIRPTVQEDGGDIEFEEWDSKNGIVKLRLQGACTGCPSSLVTLKNGIEQMLKFYIPEVKSVEQVAPDADKPKIVDKEGVEHKHPEDEEFDKLMEKIKIREKKPDSETSYGA